MKTLVFFLTLIAFTTNAQSFNFKYASETGIKQDLIRNLSCIAHYDLCSIHQLSFETDILHYRACEVHLKHDESRIYVVYTNLCTGQRTKLRTELFTTPVKTRIRDSDLMNMKVREEINIIVNNNLSKVFHPCQELLSTFL